MKFTLRMKSLQDLLSHWSLEAGAEAGRPPGWRCCRRDPSSSSLVLRQPGLMTSCAVWQGRLHPVCQPRGSGRHPRQASAVKVIAQLHQNCFPNTTTLGCADKVVSCWGAGESRRVKRNRTRSLSWEMCRSRKEVGNPQPIKGSAGEEMVGFTGH